MKFGFSHKFPNFLLQIVKMPPKKMRTSISFEVKKEICEYIQANSNTKQIDIASYFNRKYPNYNIDRSTVAKIWQN